MSSSLELPTPERPYIKAAHEDALAEAVELLRKGRLVAFPTETVYGLGGNGCDEKAIASIFAAKGRPSFNPLILHLPSTEKARPLVVWTDEAALLAQHFWPGPLTMILKRQKNCPVHPLACAGLDTMALRVPSHPVAQALLQAVDLPIAAPSANASGKLSPTTPAHVVESLRGKIDLVLASGKSAVGLESTVLDLTEAVPSILRPGFITKEQIEACLGRPITRGKPLAPNKVKSPGQLTSHYAPNCPVRLNATHLEPGEALLAFGDDSALLGTGPRLNLSSQGDLTEAAANLFSFLHQLEETNPTAIAVMPIPETGLGCAINDRLSRAAAPR